MPFSVRFARPEDVPFIASWTTETFEWGDYVPDRIAGWIDDADSEVIVCELSSGQPVALVHGLMLSGTEGWLEAARVHPDHQRSGMGSALNDVGIDWLRAKGARVARLATEGSNVGARRQVETLGYRMTTRWMHASFETSEPKDVPEDLRARLAYPPDADPAWMFWSSGELAREGRELIARGWRWRTATPLDLESAVAAKALYQTPDGWIIVEEREDGSLGSNWFATTPGEAPRLLESLLALASARGVDELRIKTPAVPWMTETLARAGGNPKEIVVYEFAV